MSANPGIDGSGTKHGQQLMKGNIKMKKEQLSFTEEDCAQLMDLYFEYECLIFVDIIGIVNYDGCCGQ